MASSNIKIPESTLTQINRERGAKTARGETRPPRDLRGVGGDNPFYLEVKFSGPTESDIPPKIFV